MTAQEVYNLFERHKKDIADVGTARFLDWINEINRFAYRILYGTDSERFIVPRNIPVVAGDSTYNLPADFLNMQPRGCGIFETDNGVASDRRLPITRYGSGNSGYYINGTVINLTPTPQVSTTLVIRYIPAIDDLTSLTETLVIPDEFIYYVKNAVDVLYDIWDEDVPAEGLADQRFVRALDELVRNIHKDSSTVGINTQSNAYY